MMQNPSHIFRREFVHVFVPLSAILLLLPAFLHRASAEPESDQEPSKGSPSDRTYMVKHLTGADVSLDGVPDEKAWKRAKLLKDMQFPWDDNSPSPTHFRAFYGNSGFFFSFRVRDGDVVVQETIDQEKDIAEEDRVELFFARSPGMETYYGMEIDPVGLALTFRASYYRNSDLEWDLPDMTQQGRISKDGYSVEGRIPLSFFIRNRLFSGEDANRVMTGVFRAEFSRVEGGSIQRRWVSWIDPETGEPDFHRPGAFGWFVFE